MFEDEKLVVRLYDEAKEELESRRVAEFGPAGGNPNARLEESIFWKAAEMIVKLRNELYGILADTGMTQSCLPPERRMDNLEDLFNARQLVRDLREDLYKYEEKLEKDSEQWKADSVELAEWKEGYQRVIDDRRPDDEQHCSCCAELRMEINRLRKPKDAT